MIIRSKIKYLHLLFWILLKIILFQHGFIIVQAEDLPIPKFQILTSNDYISIHDRITISLEHSYIPKDNNIYSFCVVFDDDNITEEDLERVWKGTSENLLHDNVQFNHIYDTVGEKTIAVYVTTSKFYLNDNNELESDGLLASSTRKIKINVEYGNYCYHYAVHIDWDPFSHEEIHKRFFNGNSPMIHIQIANAQYPTNNQLTKESTKSFSLIGDHPTLFLTNNTHSYEIESENKLNDKFEWVIKINKEYLYSINPFNLKIKSKGSTILECGIKDEDIILHIPTAYELDMGEDLTDKFKYDNSTVEGNIKVDDTIYRIRDIDVYHSTSNPNLKVLNLKLENTSSDKGDGLPSVLAFTTDFMETYKILNLRKTRMTANSEIFTTCQGTSKLSCNVQEILNVLILQRFLIVHTNTGVYYTSLPSIYTNFQRPNGGYQPSQFHRLEKFTSTVAKLGYENIKLMSTTNTITPNSTYVYTIFSTSIPSGTKNRLLYSLENYFVNGLWRALTINDIFSTLSLQNKDSKTEFISAVRFNDQNVYLIGIPVEDDRYPNLYQNCAVVIHRTDIFDKTNDFSMEYDLPPDQYFYGMSLHENNYDIFIYGTSIYHSNDGGYTFKLNAKLPQPDPTDSSQKEPEYFTEFKSSHYRSFVYFITNHHNIYYGSTSIIRYLPLFWAHLDKKQPIKYIINNHGTLSVLEYSLGSLDTNYDHSINEFYPLNQVFTSGTIPTKAVLGFSNLNGLEFETPFPLVPIMYCDQEIWLYAYETDYLFDYSHLGFIINSEGTPDRLIICDINKKQNLVKVAPQGSFTFESRTDPLEINVHIPNLKFSSSDYINFDSFVPPLKSESRMILRLLGNDENGRVWTKGDINKSIVVNYGSFIIRRIIDRRTAVGQLIFPLNSWLDKHNGVPSKSVYHSWGIYDYRGTVVEDSLVDYRVYLMDSSTPELKVEDITTISLNLERNFFTRDKMNDIIVIGDTDTDKYIIGEIVQVNGQQADIKINRLAGNIYQKENQDFSIIKSQRIFSDEKSLLDFNAMEKGWNLKMDKCHWNSFQMNDIPDINFIDYDGELNITVNVNTDNTDARTAVHYQRNVAFKMTLSNPNIISYTNSDYYGNSELILNLNIKDIGRRGMNILNVFPAHNSIHCTEVLPIKYIFNQCPPTRVIVPDFGLEDQDILYGEGGDYDKKVITLPYNYRPPSYLGTDVPIEDTFYHAHPGKPRIKNRFKVSKNTGKYKQCEGKSNRQECGCTDEQKSSMLIRNSDCIEKVIKLYQTDNYKLKFFVKEYGKETKVLDIPFNITELNNRTDYCISNCENSNKKIYDPKKDKIVWRGEELYHFKIDVDYYYCVLSTEMIYYIIQPNPGFSIETAVMCMVCFVFVIWILITYIHYRIKKVKGW